MGASFQLVSPPSPRLRAHRPLKLAPDQNMFSIYDDLASRAIEIYTNQGQGQGQGQSQTFVGIAGGPGSGKSTMADAVKQRIDSSLGPDSAVVLPMDGFHLTRAEMRAMTSTGHMGVIGDPGSTAGAFTTFDEMIARRGAPWTFDAPKAVDAFRAARREGQGSLPVYSRQKSDPIVDGVQLLSTHKVVLCEGNYLLAFDDPLWAPLKDVFHDYWFVKCALDAQRERLVVRHLQTWSDEKTRMWGEGAKGALNKANANDIPNALWVERMSLHHARVVVESN